MPETKTEEALPPFVGAVQADFAWAADTLDEVVAFLQRLEGQLRLDRDAKQCAHGVSEALQTLAGGLRKESAEFASRTLPDGQGKSETGLRVMGGAA